MIRVLMLVLAAGSASAQALTEADLRACLAGMVSVEIVDFGEPEPGTLSARREPPQGETTGWRRPDRVLTVERAVPADPTLPQVTRWLNIQHAVAVPLTGLSLHAEAGRMGAPFALGGSVLLFPGGLAPFEPWSQGFRVVFPAEARAIQQAELRLLPIDATDTAGRSFMADFGADLCR